MGVARLQLDFLLTEAGARPFSGSMLTLGRQDVWFDMRTLQTTAAERGVPLASVPEVRLADKPQHRRRRFIADETFFAALGFAETARLDASQYEGADVIFDLNERTLPGELSGRFDAIFNGGTLEHIFHLPRALDNLHGMLRQGGRIIHSAPVSNAIDHGFYCFSPTFFHDYYHANGYEVDMLKVVRVPGARPGKARRWSAKNYDPAEFRSFGLGGLDGSYYMCFCVATKSPGSTSAVIPTQGAYATVWHDSNAQARHPLQRIASRVSRWRAARW